MRRIRAWGGGGGEAAGWSAIAGGLLRLNSVARNEQRKRARECFLLDVNCQWDRLQLFVVAAVWSPSKMQTFCRLFVFMENPFCNLLKQNSYLVHSQSATDHISIPPMPTVGCGVFERFYYGNGGGSSSSSSSSATPSLNNYEAAALKT
jgi:hypothetical protein